MTVENEKDLEALLRIGHICGLALKTMLEKVEPGMTTAQLDDIGKAILQEHNAASAPIKMYKFPGWTCISINDEAAHGIPGDREIQPGDVVNIDVSAELEGYWADTAATLIVPPAAPEHKRLCKFTQRALDAVAVRIGGAALQQLVPDRDDAQLTARARTAHSVYPSCAAT